MRKYLPKIILETIFLSIAIFLGFHFKWNWVDLALFLTFLGIILHPLPSRWFAFSSILLLVATPALLAFKQEDWAEQIAIYAYYFLIFTVMMAVYELKKEEKTEN